MPGTGAALRLPETRHSSMVQHFLGVKICCADEEVIPAADYLQLQIAAKIFLRSRIFRASFDCPDSLKKDIVQTLTVQNRYISSGFEHDGANLAEVHDICFAEFCDDIAAGGPRAGERGVLKHTVAHEQGRRVADQPLEVVMPCAGARDDILDSQKRRNCDERLRQFAPARCLHAARQKRTDGDGGDEIE
jgi:hypothetical protein